ncbi:hypothetical protein ONE63_009237 [Megalurothrips usitatus]|uniref:Sodium channel protein Nach-like n=1 Tax=Megalurothrips usitatus TaxID=439358 RepID=A0AAV7XNR6_9NEOP|nr:hypothetical protein ONE63_009237 [Megalurothrips usitatus]
MTPNFGDPASLDQLPAPRRPLWRRVKDAFRYEAKEFCLFTGMHGYKYIVQTGKHRAERFFWVLVVTVSMAAAVYMMFIAYEFNRSHPTILAVDTTHFPLARVEAPGVTVCPTNKVLRSKAIRLIRTLDLPAGVTEEDVLSDMGLLVELLSPREVNASRFVRLQTILDKNSLTVDTVMRRVTPTCDDLLVRCAWKRRQCLHCSDIFRQVRTAYGYCCSFNYLDKDIKDYRPRLGGCVGVAYQHLQRLSACGYTNGLSVAVRIRKEEFLSSFLASHAIMVLIHNPKQYPDGNANLKVVASGTVSFISYLAQVTEATPRLKSLETGVRRCQFSDETFLPMFPQAYTYTNCMASCQANITLKLCGCAPYTYPHILNRKICNLLDTPCVTSLTMDSQPGGRKLNATMCPLCRPLCENVEYMVETSVGVLDFDAPLDKEPLIDGLNGSEEEYAMFHVFANDLVTTRYKMNVYMTREDLLGSLGGLSGLFVGFSLVSGFEFVYFFTIRPLFRMRARHAASRTPSGLPPPSRTSLQHDGSAHAHPASRGSGAPAAPGAHGAHPFPLAAPNVFRFRRREEQLRSFRLNLRYNFCIRIGPQPRGRTEHRARANPRPIQPNRRWMVGNPSAHTLGCCLPSVPSYGEPGHQLARAGCSRPASGLGPGEYRFVTLRVLYAS